MALMLGALNDALKSAGADEDKARKAAEEVAAYESQLSDLRGTAKLHSWMLGFAIAIMVANLFATFQVLRALP
jgi:hypothetical protein